MKIPEIASEQKSLSEIWRDQHLRLKLARKIKRQRKRLREENLLKLRHKEYEEFFKLTDNDDSLEFWEATYRKVCGITHKISSRHVNRKILQRVYEDNIKQYGTLTCYLCNNEIIFGDDEVEHKIPISRGGKSIYNNLGISCRNCNRRKHSKTEEEFKSNESNPKA